MFWWEPRLIVGAQLERGVCDHVLIRVSDHVGINVRVCAVFIVSMSASSSVSKSVVASVCVHGVGYLWPCFVRDSQCRFLCPCPYPYPFPCQWSCLSPCSSSCPWACRWSAFVAMFSASTVSLSVSVSVFLCVFVSVFRPCRNGVNVRCRVNVCVRLAYMSTACPCPWPRSCAYQCQPWHHSLLQELITCLWNMHFNSHLPQMQVIIARMQSWIYWLKSFGNFR